MPDQAVWMQSATVGPTGTRRLARLAAEHHVAFVDAPVVGTKKPAEEGTLVVLVSGANAVIEQLAPVLAAIGSKSVTVGDELGGASALKLACNAWIASVTAAVGQSLTISHALGVDARLFLTAIDGGPSNAPYAQLKGDMMIDQDFSPAFAVDGLLKDLELMESELDGGSASTALVRTLRDLFARASSSGHGSEDVAAVITALNSR
jgi:3-hydroxyisobutyrate dehydrogenase